jgi:alpha-D-ribose 1-methylphosphonate 5-triphosphate synthase subunit PhnH
VNAPLDLARLAPGFSDPGLESQRLFRRLMEAMARPGRVESAADAPAPPAGVSRAAGAVLLTLCDAETSLWLPAPLRTSEAAGWLRFHTGCPMAASPAAAAFALARADDRPALDSFSMGDPKYPDRSTTLVLEVASLSGGASVRLEGPGIRDGVDLAPAGLDAAFWAERADLAPLFPCGLDIILTADDAFVCLPRTTRATVLED